MALSNSLPDAIQWSEGMLLSPQHFQQNDDYWHQQLRHRLHAITSDYWGVLQLNCQLINETIIISKLECILPDGLLVEFPGRYPRVPKGDLDLSIGAECKAGGVAQKVWLLVNPRGAKAACQESKERRYNSILDNNTADENSGEGGFNIARLQVEFTLVLASKSPSAEGAVPLCEVKRGDNGQLKITPYHPPQLRLDACVFHGELSLFKKLNTAHETLWSKAQQLAALFKKTDHEGDMDPHNRQCLMAARALGRCLPELSILLSPSTHPSRLYTAIAHVVGELSGIGSNPLPLLMRPYQHDDCLPQFQAAIDYIEGQLKQVNVDHESLLFRRVDQHDNKSACFERYLTAPISNKLIVELEPKEGQTHQQLFHWLKQSIIAGELLVPQLRRSRLLGAKVRELSKTEIYHYKLRPQAALYAIENQLLPFDDDSTIKAFEAEQLLLIIGKNDADTPISITLHDVTSSVSSMSKSA